MQQHMLAQFQCERFLLFTLLSIPFKKPRTCLHHDFFFPSKSNSFSFLVEGGMHGHKDKYFLPYTCMKYKYFFVVFACRSRIPFNDTCKLLQKKIISEPFYPRI
jgi:hypothetical protein